MKRILLHCKRGHRFCSTLTHVDPITNSPRMVDISDKLSTIRKAHARCKVSFPAPVIDKLNESNPLDSTLYSLKSSKGPIIATAIVAGKFSLLIIHFNN